LPVAATLFVDVITQDRARIIGESLWCRGQLDHVIT